MIITDLNIAVRAIVREELERLVPAALLRPPPPKGDPVAAFLRTLAPGSEVGAAELYRRFCEAQGAAERRRSIQWFGRRARASGLVRAEHQRRGEVYVVVERRELAGGACVCGHPESRHVGGPVGGQCIHQDRGRECPCVAFAAAENAAAALERMTEEAGARWSVAEDGRVVAGGGEVGRG